MPKELKKYRKFDKKQYKLHKIFTSKHDAMSEQAKLDIDGYKTRRITADLWRVMKKEKWIKQNKPVLEYRIYKRKKSKK